MKSLKTITEELITNAMESALSNRNYLQTLVRSYFEEKSAEERRVLYNALEIDPRYY